MIDFTIKLAGKVVEIHCMFPTTKAYCGAYLSEETPDFSITITPEDLAFEREKSIREAQLEGIPVQNFKNAHLETIAVQRKITECLFERDTLLFHGSVVAVDGQAYLFTAKSGTGKSTHTRFWRETFGDRAVMVNDDKPFLQITDDGVLACGSPWNGKHGLGNNIRVPLKAICILERGEENQIQPISGKEATMVLFQQSNRPMDPRKLPLYLDLIDRLSRQTSLYRMYCNLDPKAAQIAFDTMSK